MRLVYNIVRACGFYTIIIQALQVAGWQAELHKIVSFYSTSLCFYLFYSVGPKYNFISVAEIFCTFISYLLLLLFSFEYTRVRTYYIHI